MRRRDVALGFIVGCVFTATLANLFARVSTQCVCSCGTSGARTGTFHARAAAAEADTAAGAWKTHAAGRAPATASAASSAYPPTGLAGRAAASAAAASNSTAANGAHPPTGSHLVLDLTGMPFAVLNDAALMHERVVEVAARVGTVLKSTVHAFDPIGVTAIALIAESHVAIHTYPEHGVALVDVFTCAPRVLVDELELIVTTLGARLDQARWSIFPRGKFVAYAKGDESGSAAAATPQELAHRRGHRPFEVLTAIGFERKTRVFSAESAFQNVQVWEFPLTGRTEFGDPAASFGWPRDNRTGEQLPERRLYLNGVAQSSTFDEAIYHESLVHPALLSHERGAERVLIVGGGEGATLREVLKHTSVKQVVMIELDAMVTDVARAHMPSMSDCSAFGAKSCFDDRRVTTLFEDGLKWISARFWDDVEGDCRTSSNDASRFDAVIMDLIDPDEHGAKLLYSDAVLEQTLGCALKADGVYSSNVGGQMHPIYPGSTPADELAITIVDDVSSYAKSTYVFECMVPSWLEPWTIVVAFKSLRASQRWWANSARVNVMLQQRLHPRARPLAYYDGTVHASNQQLPKAWQQLHCYLYPEEPLCDAFQNPRGAVGDVFDTAGTSEKSPEDFVRVQESAKYGRAVAATRDLRPGTVIGGWDAATSFEISRADMKALHEFARSTGSDTYKALYDWIYQYGYACDTVKGGLVYVSLTSLLTFVNAADNTTSKNVVNLIEGEKSPQDEDKDEDYSFDPVETRHPRETCIMTKVGPGGIAAGEIVIEDYGEFDFNDGKWPGTPFAAKLREDFDKDMPWS